MSIKTEIDRIKQSKADIISALKLKGVTVPSDASIDDLSALVEAIEVNTSEDLSSELSTQNTLITTQETTIDNIISALQGKAAGGSSGGGISTEIVELTLSITSESSSCRPTIYYTINEYGETFGDTKTVNTNTYSTTINVPKHSYAYIVPPSIINMEIFKVSASSGIETIPGNIMVVQVNESGTLSVSSTNY